MLRISIELLLDKDSYEFMLGSLLLILIIFLYLMKNNKTINMRINRDNNIENNTQFQIIN